jgi:hypothetical protein
VRPAIAPLALLLALGSTPALAQSASVWGSSSTFLRGFVRPADSGVATYLPFFEQVELHGRRLGFEGLSVHAGLWGMVDLVDLQDRYRASGDVSTLYLEYRAPTEGRWRALRGLEIAGGRQFVALGPTILEQVDGGKLHYVHPSGLELGIFGGAPTGTRVAYQLWPTDEDRYNYGYSWLIGGRLGFINFGHMAAGITVVHRRYRGRVADNDLGLDLSYAPLSWLDVSASAVLSVEAMRAKEVKGGVSLQPLRALSFHLGYRYTSPDLYIPRTSIFAVFADSSFQEASIDARWQVTRALSLDADYGRRFYLARGGESTPDQSDGANRATLRATLRFGQSRDGRALAEVERVESPDNAANRVRLATSVPFWLLSRQFAVIADLDFFVLDEPIRETRTSFIASGYLAVPLVSSSKLRLLAGGSGGVTPLLDSAGSFLVRLVWDFEAPVADDGVQVQRGRLP